MNLAIMYLCIKIFCVRIVDVSLGTIRAIITVKGKALTASIVGFFEVFIWFVIVKEALNTDQNSIFIAVAYSLGFATGTYVGSILSDIFINGTYSVQIITKSNKLIEYLETSDYAVSVMDIYGIHEMKKKYMLYIEVNKNKANSLLKIIKRIDPKAFTVMNETKYVMNGYIK